MLSKGSSVVTSTSKLYDESSRAWEQCIRCRDSGGYVCRFDARDKRLYTCMMVCVGNAGSVSIKSIFAHEMYMSRSTVCCDTLVA